MKILIIYHAGACDSARALYREMASQPDVELTVAVPSKIAVEAAYDPSGWFRLEREVECDGYRMIPVELNDPRNYGAGFNRKALSRTIGSLKPDIIHVLDDPTSGYLHQVLWLSLLRSPRSKVLFYGFQNLPFRLGRRARLKWGLVWRRLAGGTAANTEVLDNLVAAGFPRHRPLRRIFWGIPTDAFCPMDRQQAKASLGLEFEQAVGYVGRLSPEKGLVVLLAAMLRLPARVHCLLVGDGPMRAELELLSASPPLTGRVHLVGAVPSADIARYLSSADVLALPSLTTPWWKEQFGRVIAEAMACGIPVVASDSGAIPEVVGDAGLTVPEGAPEALARALSAVLSDLPLRQRLIAAGLKRAHEKLSAKAFADRHVEFYKALIGRS